MKKNLRITGTVLFERKDFVKMIEEVLLTEGLQLERVVPVDEKGEAVHLESLVCYVHQPKAQDEITHKYDLPQKKNAPSGYRRPNYGLTKFFKELFSDGRVYTLDEIFEETKEKFPKLTKKKLRLYLLRTAMTGPLERDLESGMYWNPNGKKLTPSYEIRE